MDTRFAFRIRVSYPVRRRRAAPRSCGGGRWRPLGTTTSRITPGGKCRDAGVVCGISVTAVKGRSGLGVILSQGTLADRGRACDGTREIRCAPDLIRAPKERADG